MFESPADAEVIEPMFLTLGTAMGGGARRGRFIEVFGDEGTGKTTLAVQHVGADLKSNEIALFEDFEHTFSPAWVSRYTGIEVVHLTDAEKWFKKHAGDHPPVMLWSQPQTLEDGLGLADELVEGIGPRFRHLIIDSVASMVPKEQAEKDAEEHTVALRARRFGHWIEKAVPTYAHNETSIWCINQVRERIGVMGFSELAKLSTPGGRALKFYCTHRLFLKPGYDRVWSAVLGQDATVVEITIVKNKVDPTKRGKTRLVLIPGDGFSPEIELIELAEQYGVLRAEGAGAFTFNGTGPYSRAALLKALRDSVRGRQLVDLIAAGVREKAKGDPIWFEDYKPKAGGFSLDDDPEHGDAPTTLPPPTFTASRLPPITM